MRKAQLSRWRVAAATFAVWVPAVVLLTTRAIWWSRLPETLPIHWSGLGRPDNFWTTTLTWTTLFALTVVAGVLAVIAAAVSGRDPATTRGLFGLAGGIAGLFAGIWLASVSATLASGNPAEARLGWRVLLIVAGLAWSAVVYAVAGAASARPAPPPSRSEGLGLAPGERAAWVTVLRSRLLVTVPIVAAVFVAVVAATINPFVWIVLPLIAAMLALFAQVRVTVDHRGLRLVAGLLGLPFKRIRLAEITSASAQHIDPPRWGGWGYRVIPGRSALVLRSGPGLVIELRDGRLFAITLDDPGTPAALLASLREQDGQRPRH